MERSNYICHLCMETYSRVNMMMELCLSGLQVSFGSLIFNQMRLLQDQGVNCGAVSNLKLSVAKGSNAPRIGFCLVRQNQRQDFFPP